MLRETMTSTIPVAMMATIAVWTVRNQRFRGVRKVPPVQKWKPTQMISSPMIIPNMRVSISKDLTTRRNRPRTPPAPVAGSASSGVRAPSDVVVLSSVTAIYVSADKGTHCQRTRSGSVHQVMSPRAVSRPGARCLSDQPQISTAPAATP